MMRNRQAIVIAAPVAVVAVVAGIVSYAHIEHLALAEHQPLALARLFPFAVDGLIMAGSAVLLGGMRLGWLAVVPGIAATLFANVQSGLPFGVLAAVVAGWPAIAFSVASYVLERWLRSQVTGTAAADDDDEPVIVPAAPAPAAALNGHGTGPAWSQPAVSGWS
jgi:hypothetical protein